MLTNGTDFKEEEVSKSSCLPQANTEKYPLDMET